MGVQAEELGQDSVAAVAQFNGFQSSEESALLLVQQAVEEQNSGLEFIGRDLKGGGIGHQWHGAGGLPGTDLISRLSAIGGSVQESTGYVGTAQATATDQIVKGILDLGVESIRQLVGEPSARSLTDKRLNGGNERAITRKPDGVVRPEAYVIEASDFAERIVAAAMGIAGSPALQNRHPAGVEAGPSAPLPTSLAESTPPHTTHASAKSQNDLGVTLAEDLFLRGP